VGGWLGGAVAALFAPTELKTQPHLEQKYANRSRHPTALGIIKQTSESQKNTD